MQSPIVKLVRVIALIVFTGKTRTSSLEEKCFFLPKATKMTCLRGGAAVPPCYFMLNEEGDKDPAAASFPDVLGWRAVHVELWVLWGCWYGVS